MTQRKLLNLLYSMEEIAEAALAVNYQWPERLRNMVDNIRLDCDRICGELEEDPGGPEFDPNFTVVELDAGIFSNPRNAHTFKRLYEHKGRKLMVMIHRDFYEQQCWARISILDPTRFTWSPLYSASIEAILDKLQDVTPVIGLRPEQQSGFYQLAEQLCEAARTLMFTPDEDA